MLLNDFGPYEITSVNVRVAMTVAMVTLLFWVLWDNVYNYCVHINLHIPITLNGKCRSLL
jgi:hypothetical protein